MSIRVGIAGFGQIARVQHAPALAATPGLVLAAVANPAPTPAPTSMPIGVRLHASLADMLGDGIDAVAICTPPQIRYDLAMSALAAGKHVLLEKPPAATPAEAAALAAEAERRGLSLFTAWHALFNAGVEPARAILAERGARAMRMTWKEDARKFHPGVDWFWQPGGMGVFDPGINAFSILSRVMPEPVFVRRAAFAVLPGAHTPVAARLEFATPSRHDGFTAELDFQHQDGEIWSIAWTLDDGGRLVLDKGGARLAHDGDILANGTDEEYRGVYARFRDLIQAGRSDVETRPLQLVADAFLVARRDEPGPPA